MNAGKTSQLGIKVVNQSVIKTSVQSISHALSPKKEKKGFSTSFICVYVFEIKILVSAITKYFQLDVIGYFEVKLWLPRGSSFGRNPRVEFLKGFY